MSRRIALSLWMLAAILSIMTLTATGFGALPLPVSLLWNGSDEAMRQIWLTIRLPRVLLALVIGGALALAGCVMQGLFRNPLADPGLLGISSGAALAVALWVVIPVTLPALMMLYAPMVAAFLGALAATVVIFLLSQQRHGSLSRLLLVGIAINALCGAVEKAMKEQAGEDPLRREGYRDGTWVLLDYGCVVVHVFSAEAREFYSLERLWHDGKPVDLSGVLTEN